MISGFGKSIRSNIIFGALTVMPVVVTIIVLKWLFTVITDITLTFVPQALWRENALFFRVIAFVVEVVLLFMVGLLIRNILGKRLYHAAEQLVVRIPFFNKIYVAVRQLMEAFFSDRQTLFREVVAVEFPRPGLQSVGFVTAVVAPDVAARMKPLAAGDEYLSILIPHTPNPTSGWLCIAPRSQVVPLPMTTGDAMKLVMSCGAVFPGDAMPGETRPTFLDKLDAWLSHQAKSDD